MARLLKNLISLTFGVLFLLAAGAWILVVVYRDNIRIRVEQALDKQVDALVTFDDLSVTAFRDFPNVTLTLHRLLVMGRDEFALDTLAHVDEFDVEIRTLSLLWGMETELKSIHLRRPHLSMLIMENGKANYTIFPSDSVRQTRTESSSRTYNIALDEIRMTNGEVRYRDMGRSLDVLLAGLTFSGKGDFQQDIFDLRTKASAREFTLDDGKLRYFSKKELEVDLVTEINLANQSYTFKENQWRINHFRFGIEGDLAMLEKGYNFNLTFATQETEFKNIVSLIPGIFMDDFERISTKGELGFTGFISGPFIPSEGKVPSMMANFKVTDGLFKIDTLPHPIDHIQMELQISNLYGIPDSTVFDLKKFQFNMREHVVSGRLKWKGLHHFYLDTDIKGELDLAELELMYPIRGLELRGHVNGELKAKGPLSLDAALPYQVPVFQLNMKMLDGKFKYLQLPAAVDSIQFHLVADNTTGHLENSTFDFRNLHMTLDKNAITGYCRLEGYKNLKIKTDLKADIDLADLESIFPIDTLVMKGRLTIDVVADGIYNQAKKKFPSIDAKVILQDGFLQSKGYPEPLVDIHLSGNVLNTTGNFADTRLAIDRLTYTLADEPFDIRGSVSNLETYDYDLQVKGSVDLSKVSKIYPVKDVQMSGIISADIETSGRLSEVEAGQYGRVMSKGALEVKNLQLQGSALPQPIAVSNASFVFSPTKVQLTKFDGKFGRSVISMTGDITNYMSFATRTNDLMTGDLTLQCDTLDLNEWLGEELPSGKGKPSTTQINVWKVPLNVSAVFDSEIGYVMYEDMKISHLNGDIDIKDGIFTFHETGFNALNAQFNISGDYNTRDLQHPLFDVVLDIKELDINKAYREMRLVRELLPAAGDAEGIFSISYKLKGELAPDLFPRYETLVGGGEMRIAHAKINGMKIFEELSKASKKQEVNDPHLRDFVMKSEIRDNKIFIKPFTIKVSGFDTDVEGVSEMSGAIQYLVKLELLPFGLKIPFHVTGTYDNPKVTIGKGHVLPMQDTIQHKF